MLKKEIVRNLHAPVGFHCNNFCLFCMESERKQRYTHIKSFVNNRIYSFLRENSGFDKVIFTSGEPTLNPDLAKYVKYTKKLGFKCISIISNGRMYSNGKYCLVLINSGVNEFIISIHGHTREIHDALTRAPGSFNQTITGLANMSRFKNLFSIHLTISVVINKINYKFIEDILKLLRQFTPDEIVFNVVQPFGQNMESKFYSLMPKYSNVALIFEKAFIGNPELFYYPGKNKKNRFISITDLPACLAGKAINFLGFGEERIIDDGGKTKIMDTSEYKGKREKCNSCKFEASCDGVYKNYIKHYGWDEFKAVRK